MKIFVFEYVSAGGLGETPLLTEGYAMLKSICGSLSSAGHEVHTLLCPKISKLGIRPPADKIETYFSLQDVEKILPHVDACIPIAPDNLLYDLTKMIEAKTSIIGCPSKSILSCSNKDETYRIISKMSRYFEVPDYAALPLEVYPVLEYCNEIGFPVVIKPVDGAGCEGISVVDSKEGLEGAIKKVSDVSMAKKLIAQKFCEGEPMSCSLICSQSRVLPISMNSQRIKISGSNISYLGGISPYPCAHQEEIFEESKAIAQKLELFGFVGMDLLVSGDRIYFMEINPRVTTSFIALSNVMQMGELLVDCLEDALPSSVNLNGFGSVAIFPLKRSCAVGYEKILQIPEVISPPFSEKCKVLASVKSSSLYGILDKINAVQKKLREIGAIC
ncbi:MAG: ATP-grasp domain-containing protein [Methanocellales archaeon]|nr:ATP-grasp domain-containing protein [Methanocellales archaeon]MDD3420704.1 ATP-grasp domain-containing protein [Methanocellales archaeon]MDD4897875.1 ATP-grasp domain-containing protein [Methanocellales archaeon]MDD5446441.1 ATP-grasp domain-containing protein [Methanocellales archaeon]